MTSGAVCACKERYEPKGLSLNRVFQIDPTRTLSLRARFIADLTRRFRALQRDITASIVANDVFGLTDSLGGFTGLVAAPPKAFAFPRNDQKVAAFMEWLRVQEKAGILEIVERTTLAGTAGQPWTNIYIQTAYQKGIARGRAELRKAGVDVPSFGLGAPSDINILFNQPVHAERAAMLFQRTFSELEGITAAMDQQISRVLAQGLLEGRGPRELARLITDRVDKIGITRARTLARTEIIRAHHVATVQEYRNAGIVGVKVTAEFSTAGDNRVCARCNALEGRVFTLDVIEGIIPVHGNCRCVAIPVVDV